jgi:O-antigen/teichoic acid export membrane protein
MVSVPMAVGITVFGPSVVERIYGPRWHGLALPLQVLAMQAMFRSLSSITHDMFKATGRPGLVQPFTLFRLSAVAILGIPVLRWYGMNGMCWLLLGIYVTAFIAEFATAASILGLRFLPGLGVLVKPLLLPIIAIPGVYMAMHYLIGPMDLAYLLVGCLLAAAVYVLSVFCFDRRTIDEVRALVLRRTVRPPAVSEV